MAEATVGIVASVATLAGVVDYAAERFDNTTVNLERAKKLLKTVGEARKFARRAEAALTTGEGDVELCDLLREIDHEISKCLTELDTLAPDVVKLCQPGLLGLIRRGSKTTTRRLEDIEADIESALDRITRWMTLHMWTENMQRANGDSYSNLPNSQHRQVISSRGNTLIFDERIFEEGPSPNTKSVSTSPIGPTLSRNSTCVATSPRNSTSSASVSNSSAPARRASSYSTSSGGSSGSNIVNLTASDYSPVARKISQMCPSTPAAVATAEITKLLGFAGNERRIAELLQEGVNINALIERAVEVWPDPEPYLTLLLKKQKETKQNVEYQDHLRLAISRNKIRMVNHLLAYAKGKAIDFDSLAKASRNKGIETLLRNAN